MRAAGVGLVVVVVLLGGCTGIPTSSTPEVIASGGLESANPPPNPPTPDAQPYKIVSDFLGENADSGDANHSGAQQYLTPSERARWSDDTVTVLDEIHVGSADRNHAVTVDGSVLGRIDANGVFTAVPTGDGSGVRDTFQFQTELVRVPHYPQRQWRIAKLPPGPPGLLIDSLTFQQQFQQRAIYFYDTPEQHLVPDPHYTQLLEPDTLANWLIRILATGPPDGLTSDMPAKTDPSRVSVTLPASASEPAQVLIPGASQLGATTEKHLAIEIAATLSQVASIGPTRRLTIVDGSTPVAIRSYGTTFSARDFGTAITPVTPVPELYYVDPGGGVVNESGQALPGRLGGGYYDLSSVALASDPYADGLLVAGTRLNHGVETLDIGRENAALEPVPKIAGDLSRPDWAPDVPEVWIGAGKKLYRVSETGHVDVVPIAAANGQAAGRIAAVRLSPEGSRVALVLDGTEAAQIWVGVVVRTSEGVRVQGLTPITPSGVEITDVGWNDALKLFAIGHDRDAPHAAGIYEVQCDGSRWSAKGIGILPGEPDSITAGGGQVAVVSAANSIWEQNAGSWQSLQGEETDGRAPIYVD